MLESQLGIPVFSKEHALYHLGLTHKELLVVAADIVPDDAFSRVESVEHGHTVLISLAVVRLRSLVASGPAPVLMAALPLRGTDRGTLLVAPHELVSLALARCPVVRHVLLRSQLAVDLVLLLLGGERDEVLPECPALAVRLLPRVLTVSVLAILPGQVVLAAALAKLGRETPRGTRRERCRFAWHTDTDSSRAHLGNAVSAAGLRATIAYAIIGVVHWGTISAVGLRATISAAGLLWTIIAYAVIGVVVHWGTISAVGLRATISTAGLWTIIAYAVIGVVVHWGTISAVGLRATIACGVIRVVVLWDIIAAAGLRAAIACSVIGPVVFWDIISAAGLLRATIACSVIGAVVFWDIISAAGLRDVIVAGAVFGVAVAGAGTVAGDVFRSAVACAGL